MPASMNTFCTFCTMGFQTETAPVGGRWPCLAAAVRCVLASAPPDPCCPLSVWLKLHRRPWGRPVRTSAPLCRRRPWTPARLLCRLCQPQKLPQHDMEQAVWCRGMLHWMTSGVQDPVFLHLGRGLPCAPPALPPSLAGTASCTRQQAALLSRRACCCTARCHTCNDGSASNVQHAMRQTCWSLGRA